MTRRPPSPEESLHGLLAKYRTLLLKHESLVHRLEERNTEHINTWKLSSWGLETTASGLALVGVDTIQVANKRWYELSRTPGPWRLDSAGERPPPRACARRSWSRPGS